MHGARRAWIAWCLGLAGLLATLLAQPMVAAAASHRRHRRRPAHNRHIAPCPGANLAPNGSNASALARATLCLVNRERAAHRLPALGENTALSRAATAYSLSMVRHGYFSDRSPSGGTLGQRVARSGFRAPAHRRHRVRHMALAENLATASGSLATPANIVSTWMGSPAHRANLLGRGYRASGIGVALGMPGSARISGATYTQYFTNVR
ncbi:MAG: CAP domain-containing protein [Solirubrobacteraceae bacterium]